ncbi:MAG: BlaI/MecI/CopY family transcriptional regulator [Acidobacteria bacterium]|nr:MAG: BlaI/MecI/CopY family transcriptional regulator [Acidobacteriota bacterium]
MKSARRPLTAAELEVMHEVWERSPVTVREVHERLRERKPVAYTTVMTLMNILEGKGRLRRRKEGRAFVYEPTQPKSEVLSGLVSDFLEKVFAGSARSLLVSLVRDRKLGAPDLEEIRRLVKEAK